MNIFEFIQNIAQSLLVELISTSIAIPLITYLVLKFFQNLKSARTWDVSSRLQQLFRGRAFPTIIMSTSSVHELPSGYKRPQTGIGQVRALAVFASSLSKAYRADIDDHRVLFQMASESLKVSSPKT